MLIHSDQKPYNCKYLKNKNILNIYRNFFSGTFCDQTFRQKQLLKRHENIYHNPNYVATTPKEKTHLCPTCNKAFRHKGNLMRHMAQHENGQTEPGTTKIVRVKGENGNAGDEGSDNYVVVEVLQDGAEIQYDDELELDAEQIGEEMEVDSENYTLTESMTLFSNIKK